MKTIIFIITLILVSYQAESGKQAIENKENKILLEQKAEKTAEIINNGEGFKVKLFHPETGVEFDTIVSIEFLKDDLFPFMGFNYPKLNSKKVGKNSMELFNGNVKIIIETSEFDKDNRELKFDSTNTILEKIDGKAIYGTDGNIPQKEISDFYIIVGGNRIEIPKKYYSDLFEPTLECSNNNGNLYGYTIAYLNEKGEIILTMENSDGAGSYKVIFLFDNDYMIKERIIGYQF